MITLITFILATLVFGGRIFYLFLRKRKTVNLMLAEAGPTSDAKEEDFATPVPVRVGDMQMDASLEYFLVKNNCMNPRHIYSDDVIGVQLFDDDFTLADVNQGDILLIYLDDDRFRGHKIRVMDYPEGNAFHTYYFIGGKIQNSSEPHAFDTIRGVVREINHPYTISHKSIRA